MELWKTWSTTSYAGKDCHGTVFLLKAALAMIQRFSNWPVVIGDYLGLIKEDRIRYRLRNGIQYELRPNTLDSNIAVEKVLLESYFKGPSRIGDGDTAMDIGAHIGVFTIWAARIARND